MVGRLSDIFGRRWFMIGGGVLGIIGSLMNPTAKDINTILGGTVFIGLAGAVQVSFRYASDKIYVGLVDLSQLRSNGAGCE